MFNFLGVKLVATCNVLSLEELNFIYSTSQVTENDFHYISSHFTAKVLKMARQSDISFISLPPNSTHLTQPLDVAFFKPIKTAWHQVLEKHKLKMKRATLEETRNPWAIAQAVFSG